MKNSIDSKIPTIIFVLGSILLGFLLLYLPITNMLNKSLIDKWQLSAKAEAYSVQLTLQQGIEGGNSLSSRSAIRDKILEFGNGQITWEELQTFSQPKYVDGASVLENVVFAYRLVDDQILVNYVIPGKEKIYNEIQNLSLSLEQNQILNLKDKTYFLVVSDIQKEECCLGQDIILYDISPILDNLSSDSVEIELLPIIPDSTDSQDNSKGKIITYEEELLTVDSLIRFSTSRKTILGDTNVDTYRYLALYILMLIALFALSNYIFLHQTRVVINKIEDVKEDFKHLAYQDALTSAYSRQYFLDWQEKHATALDAQNSNYILVMIDIDKLKIINDSYGHEIGDLVLQTVVFTIQENLRKDDMVIRFGGDEFIVLFKDILIDTAYQIMNRIETELEQINIQSINIKISYGITKINDVQSIEDAIKQADVKMYQVKNFKTNL